MSVNRERRNEGKTLLAGWIAEPLVEEQLSSWNLEYTLEPIDVDSIDDKASLKNQCRINPLDGETVDDFVQNMKEGKPFKAIVVTKISRKYFVLTGNHRVAAAKKAGKKRILAYIVTTKHGQIDDAVIGGLPIKLNMLEGRRQSANERIQAGYRMMFDCGWDAEKVEKEFNISRSALSNEKRARAVKEVVGIDFDAKESYLALAPLMANHDVTKAAAKVCKELNLSSPSMNELSKAVRRKHTTKEQLQVIEGYKNKMRVVKSYIPNKPKKKNEAPPQVEFVRLLSNLETFFEGRLKSGAKPSLGGIGFTVKDKSREEIGRRAFNVGEILIDLGS